MWITFSISTCYVKNQDQKENIQQYIYTHPDSSWLATWVSYKAIPMWLLQVRSTFEDITMKLWHWKSHWKFLWHWKGTDTTLKNIYKENHNDNPGLSHWNIFVCCSRTLKSHWKVLNHTGNFSALLISFVPRLFSITLDFQCDFQCHNFIVTRVFFLGVPPNGENFANPPHPTLVHVFGLRLVPPSRGSSPKIWKI